MADKQAALTQDLQLPDLEVLPSESVTRRHGLHLLEDLVQYNILLSRFFG